MENHPFSQTVSIFHELALPEAGMKLAGYAALIEAYELKVPLLPRNLSPTRKSYFKSLTREYQISP